jgi:hypothetical protein
LLLYAGEITGDGGYSGSDYACTPARLTVIDPGEVIGDTPGANSVYGVEARCTGNGADWSERARIEVERWGSALTIRRTK